MRVVPAIIPRSQEHVLESLAVLESFVGTLHIDLVDGVFGGEASWPWSAEENFQNEYRKFLTLLTKLSLTYTIEVDCILSAPEKILSDLVDTGVTSFVVHVGSTDQTGIEACLLYKNKNTRVGVSFLNDTPEEVWKESVGAFDFVQCMGIKEIGVQGNPFDPRVITTIKEVKKKYPAIEVHVDGAVSMFTLSLLKEAGATHFIIGSAIFEDANPSVALEKLTQLAEV